MLEGMQVSQCLFELEAPPSDRLLTRFFPVLLGGMLISIINVVPVRDGRTLLHVPNSSSSVFWG